MKTVLLLALCLELCGCATVGKEIHQVNVDQLQIGMSMDEVCKIVGREPSTLCDIYEKETTTDGVYDVWIVNCVRASVINIYKGYVTPSLKSKYKTYTFRFKDDKLVSYGEQYNLPPKSGHSD